MRIFFLVRTSGSALALKLAKSGSEAMIAVDPKSETAGIVWRIGEIVEGREISPPA